MHRSSCGARASATSARFNRWTSSLGQGLDHLARDHFLREGRQGRERRRAGGKQRRQGKESGLHDALTLTLGHLIAIAALCKRCCANGTRKSATGGLRQHGQPPEQVYLLLVWRLKKARDAERGAIINPHHPLHPTSSLRAVTAGKVRHTLEQSAAAARAYLHRLPPPAPLAIAFPHRAAHGVCCRPVVASTGRSSAASLSGTGEQVVLAPVHSSGRPRRTITFIGQFDFVGPRVSAESFLILFGNSPRPSYSAASQSRKRIAMPSTSSYVSSDHLVTWPAFR